VTDPAEIRLDTQPLGFNLNAFEAAHRFRGSLALVLQGREASNAEAKFFSRR
jgi:hypothetical protein